MTTPIEHAADTMWEAIDDKGINGRLNREDCTYLAEALAAAGLIATETQWAVRSPSGSIFRTDDDGHVIRSEAGARRNAKTYVPGFATPVTRNVTPWKDADA